MADIIKLDEKTYRIDDEWVRSFLLLGEKEALLVDAGFSGAITKELACTLTELPLKLFLTHADGDHTAGAKTFEEFYMHPSEEENYRAQGGTGKFVPVNEGDVIDLGNRKLEVIHLPGHTPGSVALLDEATGVLISGDVIQDDSIVAFGPARNFEAYVKSFHKLAQYKGRFEYVYPAHGTFPLKPELIDALTEAADMVYHRRDLLGAPREIDMWGMQAYGYRVGNVEFQLDRE